MRTGRIAFALITIFAAVSLLVPLAGCGGGGDTSPTPTISGGEQTSTISSPSGEVLVKKKGTEAWIAAAAGMKVGPGDLLKTGSDGHVLLLFFEGSSMEVEAGTELAIGELNVDTGTGSTLIRLQQAVGSTLNRVQKLIDPASSYEVETPAGIAAVRGTEFSVGVDDTGYTVVAAEEGSVWFTAGGETVEVTEGTQTSASPGGTPEEPYPIATPTPTGAPTPTPGPTPTATPAPTATPGGMLSDMWSESAYLGPVAYDWMITNPEGPSVAMRVWVEDNRWRYEQSAGGSTVVQLMDYDAGTMYTYFPEQNTAYRIDFDQAPQRPIEESESYEQIPTTILGTETIDGKACLVVQWTIEDTTSKSWIWEERKFPLRMEQATPQGTTTMEWSNIVFGDVPDSMFQLPAGVQVMTIPSG